MRPWLALALSLLAAPSQPEINVTLHDGRVVVRTARAPLADVLKRFGEATGMEVVYEASRPRQLVTVAIEAGSAAQALQELLEGQGLNYILRLDPTGKLAQTLVVAGSGSTAPAPAGAAARSPRVSPPAFHPADENVLEEPGAEEMPPMPEETQGAEPYVPPGSLPVEPSSPPPGVPWPGGGPGAAPGVAPGQEPVTPETPPGSTAPEPGQPQPPGPASYPGAGPMPQPPVPPGPASYP